VTSNQADLALIKEDIVQPTSDSNGASTPEMRSLTGAEIDQTTGGALWLLPIVIATAVTTYLASQKKT
jgi:hypothetical protein